MTLLSNFSETIRLVMLDSGEVFLNIELPFMDPRHIVLEVSPSQWDDYRINGHLNLLEYAQDAEIDYRLSVTQNHTPPPILPFTSEKYQRIVNEPEQLSLVEVEVIRLLYLVNWKLARAHIRSLYHRCPVLPLDIFCSGIRFYDWDKALCDHQGNILRNRSNTEEFLEKLKDSPTYGCHEAIEMLLAALANFSDPPQRIFHLESLEPIVNEPNSTVMSELLQSYVDAAKNYDYSEIKEEGSKYHLLLDHFHGNFAAGHYFTIHGTEEFPHWRSWEQMVVWSRHWSDCLTDVFGAHQINLPKGAARSLFSMLLAEDEHIESYSVGQAIKYAPFDYTELFTSDVPKPIFPVHGHEPYIIGVWMTYLYHFCAVKDIESNTLKDILYGFDQIWNQQR